MQRDTLLIILLLFTLVGCARPLPETAWPNGGTYVVPTEIVYQFARRTFLLHVPSGISQDEPLPLVVVLHGAFSTARQTEVETGFSELADREKFLVAYPEGIGLLGLLQHWNAGHCCGKAAADGVDDISFIAETIAATSERMPVDRQRVYMAGMSNGGMLTYRYAAERGDDLAAIAVVSGAIGSRNGDQLPEWQLPTPTRPLPVIAFHGTADRHIPFSGGPSQHKGGERSYTSVVDATGFWRENNRCAAAPLVTRERQGAITSYRWTACPDGNRVEYYSLENWGHQWPAPHFTASLPASDNLQGFNATEIIWQFMKDFRR